LKSARPFRPVSALDWLHSDPSFASVGEQARALESLTALVRGVLAGQPVSVIAYDRDRVVIGAAHAAWAARIRQVEPSLLATLRGAGWAVNSIRFKPLWQAQETPRPRRVKPAPGEQAMAEVSALVPRIDHPGLREALQRFAARHRG